MDSIKIIKNTIIIFSLLTFSICKSQVSSTTIISSIEEKSLILGTWIGEGSTINDKWIFTNNNLLKEYTDGSLDITYNYSIYGNINSGVKSHFIEIVNINDFSDKS